MAWYDVIVDTAQGTWDDLTNNSIIDILNPFSDVHSLKTKTVNDTPDGVSFGNGSMAQKISDAGLNNLFLAPFSTTTIIENDGSYRRVPAIVSPASKLNNAVDKTAADTVTAVSSSFGTLALIGGFFFLAAEIAKGGHGAKTA